MIPVLARWLSSVGREIGVHSRLLWIGKEDVRAYLSSPYRILLLVLFTVLFLPHVFVAVEDMNLAVAYEVDPGSFIRSILSLYEHSYNMNAAYHSRYYGWTYLSINFLLLVPVYVATVLRVVETDYYLLVSIRLVLFIIGLASVLAYFEVARRVLRHCLLSFASALLFVASPVVFPYFYFLHPETTGLLFLFLGVSCLLNFAESQAADYRWYSFGLLSLTLSVLSKQVFVLTALPVLFLFLYLFCHYHDTSVVRFVLSRRFAKVLVASTALSLLVFFIINPFAFLQPGVFAANQIALLSGHTQSSISHADAVGQWLEIIKSIPVMYLALMLSPLALAGAGRFARDRKIGEVFYLVNMVSAIAYVAGISLTSRYIILAGYFAPVFPFFVLAVTSIPLYIVRKWNSKVIGILVTICFCCFLFDVLVGDFSASVATGYARLSYRDSVVYKTYRYIEEKVPYGSRIAFDQFVAFPSDKGIVGCMYWQGCGTDYIEEFGPDYVMFDDGWTFNGVTIPETKRLAKYVVDHRFVLVDTINASYAEVGGTTTAIVSVWKKPGN